MIKLQALSDSPPVDASKMLLELGSGEAGFGGTEFGRGEMGLADYLAHTSGEVHRGNLPEGRVPQTTFWILDGQQAVGLLRMRHLLNDYTRMFGGHIGYYVRPSARRKGLATLALQLALQEIVQVGVRSVMLTTNPDNLGSIRVIEENGGHLKAQVPSEDGSETVCQYWIELEKG